MMRLSYVVRPGRRGYEMTFYNFSGRMPVEMGDRREIRFIWRRMVLGAWSSARGSSAWCEV